MAYQRSQQHKTGCDNDAPLLPHGHIHPWKYFRGERQLVIPCALLDPKLNLSYDDILYYAWLRLYGGTARCIASQKVIGSNHGVQERAARLHLSKLKKLKFIKAKRRSSPAGRITDEIEPLWHQFLEELWQAKHNTPSSLTIGKAFKWSLLAKQRWESLVIPLPVVLSVSAPAAMCYGAISKELTKDEAECAPSRATLADTLFVASRLALDNSRIDRTPARKKEFAHYPKDRVTDLLLELKVAGWIDISPQFDATRRRAESQIVFLNPAKRSMAAR